MPKNKDVDFHPLPTSQLLFLLLFCFDLFDSIRYSVSCMSYVLLRGKQGRSKRKQGDNVIFLAFFNILCLLAETRIY